jgi:hypothetical protein
MSTPIELLWKAAYTNRTSRGIMSSPDSRIADFVLEKRDFRKLRPYSE